MIGGWGGAEDRGLIAKMREYSTWRTIRGVDSTLEAVGLWVQFSNASDFVSRKGVSSVYATKMRQEADVVYPICKDREATHIRVVVALVCAHHSRSGKRSQATRQGPPKFGRGYVMRNPRV